MYTMRQTKTKWHCARRVRPLLATPSEERSHECERGTQECVRHLQRSYSSANSRKRCASSGFSARGRYRQRQFPPSVAG